MLHCAHSDESVTHTHTHTHTHTLFLALRQHMQYIYRESSVYRFRENSILRCHINNAIIVSLCSTRRAVSAKTKKIVHLVQHIFLLHPKATLGLQRDASKSFLAKQEILTSICREVFNGASYKMYICKISVRCLLLRRWREKLQKCGTLIVHGNKFGIETSSSLIYPYGSPIVYLILSFTGCFESTKRSIPTRLFCSVTLLPNMPQKAHLPVKIRAVV